MMRDEFSLMAAEVLENYDPVDNMSVKEVLDLIAKYGESNAKTNAERFREVFGFAPSWEPCVAPRRVCDDYYGVCVECPFYHWWDKGCLPYFRMEGE